jgi:hypothetical protein
MISHVIVELKIDFRISFFSIIKVNVVIDQAELVKHRITVPGN